MGRTIVVITYKDAHGFLKQAPFVNPRFTEVLPGAPACVTTADGSVVQYPSGYLGIQIRHEQEN
jgi:hypothetical protein